LSVLWLYLIHTVLLCVSKGYGDHLQDIPTPRLLYTKLTCIKVGGLVEKPLAQGPYWL